MRLLLLLNLIYFAPICIAQKYNAEFLKSSTHVVFNGNKIEAHYSYEIKINNRAGTNLAEIPIFYQLNNPPKDLNAAIYDVFGNEIRKLKKKDITTTTSNNSYFYTSNRVQTFKLIHTTFPYILKYSYSIVRKEYISIAYWTPSYSKDVLTKESKLQIEIPKDYPISVFKQNISTEDKNSTEDKDVYTWTVTNFTKPDIEVLAPNYRDIIPKVEVMPQEFNYKIKGNSTSWKEYGNWEFSILKGLDILTEPEKKVVHEITDTISDRKEKIKALYHYLQDNTRYVYISMKRGGLIPHSASYVCNNKYGDCKALSNYMKALLNEIDIPSFYTSVYADDNPIKINPNFVSQQFNHIILCVPNSNDTIWLECTSKTSPFNYLGTFTQNRLVHLIEENKSRLVRTPALSINDTHESYFTEITVNEENGSTFKTNAILKGYFFEKINYFKNHLSDKDKSIFIDNIGLSNKTDVKDFEIINPHRDSTYLNLNLKGSVNNLTESIGDKIILKPFKVINFNLEKPEKRINDIVINYPINTTDSIHFIFTENISSIKGIKNQSIKNKFGAYTKTVKFKNNKLLIVRNFQLAQGKYSTKEYIEFYNFYLNAYTLDNKKSIISF